MVSAIARNVSSGTQRAVPAGARGGSSFGEVLKSSVVDCGHCGGTSFRRGRTSLAADAVERLVSSIETDRRMIDGWIDGGLRGDQMSSEELLGWQARVFRYNERVELVSRVVDRLGSSAKTILTMQV